MSTSEEKVAQFPDVCGEPLVTVKGTIHCQRKRTAFPHWIHEWQRPFTDQADAATMTIKWGHPENRLGIVSYAEAEE